MLSLSVIVPCYRAGNLALHSAKRLEEGLARHFDSWEVIVVDDGGCDISAESLEHDGNVRVIRFAKNQGKGAAVRAGMLAATGDVRVFTDVDLPYGIEEIPVMAKYIRHRGFHVVIGDRTLPTSIYKEELRKARRVTSSVFSAFVGRIVTGGFFDTQCGLKAFRGDVADALFPMLSIDRFAFDVELLYVCLKARLDIKRVPVRLESNATTSVRLLRDSTQGVIDIGRIKYYQVRRRYRLAELESIVQRDHDNAVAVQAIRG